MSPPSDTTPQPAGSVAISRWLLPILFLAAGAVFAGYYCGLLGGRPQLWPDSYEYAQAARAIAQGRGLVTDAPTVLEFSLLYRGTLPLPYFAHDVGNVLLQAPMFWLLGSNDVIIPMASGLSFALLAPATFLFGRRLFGVRVGVFATVLVLSNAQLLAHAATGLSEVPTALLLTVLLGLLVHFPRSSSFESAIIGAAFGSLVVVRSNALVFLPWVGLWLWTAKDPEGKVSPPVLTRARALAGSLAGFVVVWGPAAVRTQLGLGRPWFTVASLYSAVFHTSGLPGGTKGLWSRPGAHVDAIGFLAAHPGELLSKVSWQLHELTTSLLNGGLGIENDWVESVLIFLFAIGLVAPPPEETVAQRRARRMLLAMVATSVAAGFLFFIRWRHLYAFIPAVLVYDAEVLMRVLGGGDARRLPSSAKTMARLGFTAALLAALGWGRLAQGVSGAQADEERARNDYYQALGEFLRQNTRRNAVVLARCSGVAELRALAWYGRRQIVEDHPFTEGALMARASPSPLFLLATSGPGEGQPVDEGPPGFVSVAQWHSGSGDSAVLYSAPR